MPFHVRVTTRSQRHNDELKLDLDQRELEERFLRPYREGRPMVVGGRTIAPDDLERIRINFTRESAAELAPILRAERQRSSVVALGISDEWYIADRGEDVTDQFITGPPGEDMPAPETAAAATASDPRKVFVVHGRNALARDAIFTFLRTLGLQPIEWNEARLATGRPSPYVGEILDATFGLAQAVLVLMTPDDEARLKESLRDPGDPPHETDLTGQARPNVLFEAGMAMGRDENRTVLVELGTLRPFSDIGGRHVLRLDDSSERRQELAQRLQSAGCSVTLTGTDWHSAGDFGASIST